MEKVALFFAPHPDDVEFGCSFYYLSLLEQGYRVVQVVMTDGAFGTSDPKFKGKRIVRIRERELDQSTRVFENATKNQIEVIRLGYTDGYLPFNVSTRNKIIDLIQSIKPSMIFAPDPWYSKDYHPDHMNTGRLVIFAIKKISSILKEPIQLILFYSYVQNHFVSVKKGYLKVLYKALSQHKSQVQSPVIVKIIISFIAMFVIRNFIKHRHFSAGYRNQEYDSNNNPIFPPKFESDSFKNHLKYYIYYYPTLKVSEKLHNKSPAEIGIEVKE